MALVFAQNISAAFLGANPNGDLVIVDTDKGGATLIGNTGIFLLAALEFSPNGTLYGFSAGEQNALYTINPNNAVATSVGSLTDFPNFVSEGGFAISSSDAAWGANVGDIGGTRNSQLFTVDLGDANTNNLGTIANGEHDFNGLVWRSDGKLVGLDGVTSSLLAIDLDDLSTTVIAATVSGTQGVGGLTTRDYETGFFTIGFDMYIVDLFSGVQTPVGNTGVLLSGLAITPIPIPPAVWLFGFGLLGLVSIIRRKKLA